jgi:hypothetical protein
VELNRREFLALTGSAVAVRFDARVRSPDLDGTISVLHLEEQGHLLESVKGYQRALGRPAVGVSGSSVVMAAHRGATVIIECGVTANDALTALGVSAEQPRNLWRRGFSPEIPNVGPAIPYIDYSWPIVVKVRDFSRVVPVNGPGWDHIAEVDGVCVGLTRRFGRGRLVVLGSPLGPVLLGEDREAHEWLDALIATTAAGSARRFLRTAPVVPEMAGARSRA